MSVSDTFKLLIDKVVTSSQTAKNTAANFASYDINNLSDPPVHILNDSSISQLTREATMLRENITKLITKHFGSALSLTLSITVSYFVFKWLLKALDPTREQKKDSQKKGQDVLKSLGILPKLDEYELCIASDLIDPSSMQTNWTNIGGLKSTIEDIKEHVLLPFRSRRYASDLVKPPKGVLLYGPPGCGKTMIAKAIAKESDAQFLNLQVTSLMDKWYGETEKRVKSIFSLASKISPTIIFIDEIDSFLSTRDKSNHETSATVKTQFMVLWDGLNSDPDNKIMIIGATNRLDSIDPAILRRMPAKYYIGLPDAGARNHILRIMLKDQPISDDVDTELLSERTESLTGSDLHELCRTAAIIRLKHTVDYISNDRNQNEEKLENAKKFTMQDFNMAINKFSK